MSGRECGGRVGVGMGVRVDEGTRIEERRVEFRERREGAEYHSGVQ